MPEAWPRISIVISTIDRPRTLSVALDSLEWLAYPGEFEVVVVNGPSGSETAELLRGWADRIKVRDCAVKNLSASRNIGIAAAAGEIVAFMDDDAVPEAEWLTELAAPYQDPWVGAAGGFVFDHTGRGYQATYTTVNRLGDPVDSHGLPAVGLVYPYSYAFPHLLGTNASFRRTALVEVGGLDEEYEYFLDETDLQLRIMDAGWGIVQIAGAHIHHKFAPSDIRDLTRVARDRYAVVKNRTYFSSRHAAEYLHPDELHADQLAYAARHRAELADAAERGLVEQADLAAFDGYWERALETGRRAAERGGPLVVGADWRGIPPSAFLPFETRVESVQRVILTAEEQADGVVERRAVDYSLAGLIPHVIRPTEGPSNIDFRDGVWWHSVAATDAWAPLAAAERDEILGRFLDARVE